MSSVVEALKTVSIPATVEPRHTEDWDRKTPPVPTSTTVNSSIMMISQFWNLCRACPALDVDKVGSYTAFYYLPVLKCLNKIYFNTGNFDWQKYFISKKLKIFLRSSKKK